MKERKINRSDVTAELVRELLEYNPHTGEMIWKHRSPNWFANNSESHAASWNGRFAGKRAGTVTSTGYAVIGICYRLFCFGRVSWLHFYGAWPEGEIDHIDGDPKNNSIANLREANRSQNAANRRLQSNNKTGLKGVTEGSDGMFRSYISVNGKNTYLGTYLTRDEAYAAWQGASKLAFGEFHRGSR